MALEYTNPGSGLHGSYLTRSHWHLKATEIRPQLSQGPPWPCRFSEGAEQG